MSPFRISCSRPACRRRQRGVATIEFVVCAPLLLMMMLAVAEIGRAFVHYVTLSNSVRHSAGYLARNALNGTTDVVVLTGTTVNRARNLAVFGNILGTGTPKLPNYQVSQIQISDAGGDNVRVVATYPYQPMLGPLLPDFGYGSGSTSFNFNMHIAVTMRAIPS